MLAPSRQLVCAIVCALAGLLFNGCRRSQFATTPRIEFRHVPPNATGGAGDTDVLSGLVLNVAADTRLVVYVHSRGTWYVQPLTTRPFTAFARDGTWSTPTHLGYEYAAVLVRPAFRPSNTLHELPQVAGSVLAVNATAGDPSSVKPQRSIHFGTYDWSIRELGSDRNGSPHTYSASNVSVDDNGSLHLRIENGGNECTCSEVALKRSLGYGRYILTLTGVDKLEPATVFNMFTWDAAGTDQDRREMEGELTRWGDPQAKNGEFAVQPFFRPMNTYRYSTDASSLTLQMNWHSGVVNFTTVQSASPGSRMPKEAEHTFTSDIPSPKSESLHLNLCTFDYGKSRQMANSEVVIESFRYLP